MPLAIVIPTLDEAAVIESCLLQLDSQIDRNRFDLIVISDGGSQDTTVEIASGMRVEVVQSEPGRGVQLHAGAMHAISLGADALVFCHADTVLPPNAVDRVREALESGSVGGGFFVRFDPPHPLLRLGGALVNLRCRLFKVPLGDQAQFSTTAAYTATGGFPPWPILEDVGFLGKLRRQGRLTMLAPPVATSARRFMRGGILRTLVRNWLIFGLYFLGWSPQRLSRLYRKVR